MKTGQGNIWSEIDNILNSKSKGELMNEKESDLLSRYEALVKGTILEGE